MRCNFFLLVALAAKVYAGPVFVDLGTIFIPLDINNSGQMLGTIPDGNRTAALWNLGGHNAHFSVVSGGEPIAINDVGQILLSFGISQNGVFMALPARFSDLNNSAQLVGTSDNTAVLFQNGMQTNLMPPSAHSSFGNGINDAGHVVGYFTIGPEFGPFQQSGFLWRNGQFTQIGPLPGGQSGGASGLNSSDQVIGTSSQGNPGSHAFLWQNGVYTLLGTLGGIDTFPYDINNLGQVVGLSTTTNGDQRAFLWQNGVITDLVPGFRSNAFAINDRGEIIGQFQDAHGAEHGFLLTSIQDDVPTPEVFVYRVGSVHSRCRASRTSG